jgi:hypothetical protein
MFTAIQLGPYIAKVRMQAFALGVAELGGRVVNLPAPTLSQLAASQDLKQAQFAFTSGMHDNEALGRGWLAGLGKPLLVLDCGWFQRAAGPNDQVGYNQLGLNKLAWVPPEDCPPERFASLGVKLEPAVQDRPKVALVLGQVPGDSQHHLNAVSLSAWLSERAAGWLARGWKVFYRAHPKAPTLAMPVRSLVINPVSEIPSASFARAAVVVTYNSTAGLEALLAGMPVDCHPSAHYAGLRPGTPELLAHCRRLAWTQWTCDELRSGEPLRWMNRFAPLLQAAEAAA